MSKAKKAALYIRVSTNHQIDKDSLPLQRKDLITYAEVMLGISDYEIFEDAGYSGKNVERPAYQDMMRRCRQGEFSHILVWKIDRISRNLVDFASMYEELKKLGITFVSKNEQFDTSAAIGGAMLKIILVFAELERNMTSERVSAVMVDRAKKGLWNGAGIPYGYSYDKEVKYPVLNPDEAVVVKAIFEHYAQKRSLVKVIQWLNSKNYTAKRGGKWYATTVHQILTNPFYIGTYRYNLKHGGKRNLKPKDDVIVVENAHEPLIEKELFDKCQKILAANSSFRDKEGKTKIVYHTNIFAGLVECGCCGRSLKAQIRRAFSNGIRFASYCCSSRYDLKKTSCTNLFAYHDKMIGNFVMNYISNIINAKNHIFSMRSPKELEHHLLFGSCFADVVGIAEIDSLYFSFKANAMAKDSNKSKFNYNNSDINDDDKQTNKVKQELTKKERALERLNKLFLYDEEAMSEAEYIVTKNQLRKDIVQLQEELANLSAPALTVSDDVYISNASTFILSKVFESEDYIDFGELVELIDKPALREFVLSTITKITTNNQHVTCIEFSNGSIHHFAYK